MATTLTKRTLASIWKNYCTKTLPLFLLWLLPFRWRTFSIKYVCMYIHSVLRFESTTAGKLRKQHLKFQSHFKLWSIRWFQRSSLFLSVFHSFAIHCYTLFTYIWSRKNKNKTHPINIKYTHLFTGKPRIDAPIELWVNLVGRQHFFFFFSSMFAHVLIKIQE